MFSLWYTLLSWREYKDTIWNKLAPKSDNEQKVKEEIKIMPVMPTPKPEPSRIPVVDNTQKTPSVPKLIPQSTPKPISNPQSTNIKTPSAEPLSPNPKAGLEPPLKPPRSPSPHPMRSEAFDDIEFDSEESEEEDEQNSVIDSTIYNQKPVTTNVKEFLTGEINNLEKES